MSDKIKGGLSDDKSVEYIAKKHNVSIESIKKQIHMGIKIEMDHTNDKSKAREIAMDHLMEIPDYYTKLKDVELKEVTDASSSGAYDVPLFGSNKGRKDPLKIDGVSSIKKSRAVIDRKFPKWGGPGGIFVKIKDKCKKYPYCNQGDINALELLENVDFMNELALEYGITNKILKKIIKEEIMKPKNIETLIENELVKQLRKIMKEQMESKKFHIKTKNGELVDSFSNMDDAQKELEEYKKAHPTQEFLIDKGNEIPFEDLDEMSQDCEECGMNENDDINDEYTHFAILKDNGKIINGWSYSDDLDKESIKEYCVMDIKDMGYKPKDVKVVTKGFLKKNEIEPFDKKNWLDNKNSESSELNEEVCENCKKSICECSSMNENKKRVIRLKESELVSLINKIINEDVPGVFITKASQTVSKRENKANLSDVNKKIKDYLNFDGNDNPEFPNSIKKGDKKLVNNTKEEDEIVDENRGRNSQDLTYDNKPSNVFIEKTKKHLKGDSTTGNSQKNKEGNVIPTETGDNIEKLSEKRKKIKKEEPRYKKETIPTKKAN